MIVREDGDTLLLVTQPDHARLAGEVAAALRSEPGLSGPARDAILLAAREHDNGWIEVDAAPGVDPQTGRPYNFITGPAHLRHDLWLRGVTRVARMHPRAGALVAEHALTVYGYRAQEVEWHTFFTSITALRDDLLRALQLDEDGRDAFQRDYRAIQLTDALSLHFCQGWTDVQETLGYRAQLDGTTLGITPDPFAGASVPLRVMARRIPARRYANDSDLQAALSRSVREVLTGEARGTM